MQVLIPEGRTTDGLDLPDKAEIVPIKPGLENVRTYAQPVDMAIIPIAVLQRWIGSAALEFDEAGRSVTLMIAASAGKTTKSIFIWARQTDFSLYPNSVPSSKRMNIHLHEFHSIG